MSVERFDPSEQLLVEVTPAACEHFRRQLAASSDARGVRLSVKESGCTGFMYVLDLAAEAGSDDVHLPLADDLELWLDPASVAVIRGTRIDFVTEGVNRQLAFLNPNAKDYCGCGESFSIN